MIYHLATKSIQLIDNQAVGIEHFCRGMVHIGGEIEKRARTLKISAEQLAKKISTTKQNVYLIFKRKSIDTDQLQQISKALNFNFFELYKEDLIGHVKEPIALYQRKTQDVVTKAHFLTGQYVVIIKPGKSMVGVLFSIESKRNKSEAGELLFIDVLPQKYFRDKLKIEQYHEIMKDTHKEEVFRMTFCEQVKIEDIIDIQTVDETFRLDQN